MYTKIYTKHLIAIVIMFDFQKSEVNFGLYSSNWTEMDLKFKKTLLLTMQMNAAHRRVIKISPLYVVNLEMFSQVSDNDY